MKNNKSHTILLIIALCLMTLSFFTVLYNSHRTPKLIEKRDTTIIRDTIWKDTTITEKQLIPHEVIKKKVDTLYLKDGRDTLLVTEDKYFYKSSVMGLDTADVEIHTRGINTSIEELKMRLRLHNVHTTETVEITKYVEKKKKWFHIQPQATFGYDPLNKNWGAVVGIGIGVDI